MNIVQRIVTLLDLHLEVRSTVGEGSVFTLSLPMGLNTTHREADERTSATPLAPAAHQHILLVEDDPAVRDATRMLLKIEGYRVSAVSTIAEALHRTETETFDLVITDYHLADGEVGTALISALRQKLGPTLKTVLVTGDTSSVVKELPADPYLCVASKPIKADTLLELLRSFPSS